MKPYFEINFKVWDYWYVDNYKNLGLPREFMLVEINKELTLRENILR